MSPSPTPEGPGSVSGAPHLPDGFADTFTCRYVDTLAVDPEALHGSFQLYRAFPYRVGVLA